MSVFLSVLSGLSVSADSFVFPASPLLSPSIFPLSVLPPVISLPVLPLSVLPLSVLPLSVLPLPDSIYLAYFIVIGRS